MSEPLDTVGEGLGSHFRHEQRWVAIRRLHGLFLLRRIITSRTAGIILAEETHNDTHKESVMTEKKRVSAFRRTNELAARYIKIHRACLYIFIVSALVMVFGVTHQPTTIVASIVTFVDAIILVVVIWLEHNLTDRMVVDMYMQFHSFESEIIHPDRDNNPK